MSESAEGGGSAAGRERCPTCRALRRDAVCPRCKTDLSPLLQLERRADGLRHRARRCYARGWYRQAAALAGEVVALESSPEDLALLACASLMAGDFPAASNSYRRICLAP